MNHPRVFLLDENPTTRQATLLKLLALDVQVVCCDTVQKCIDEHQFGRAGCLVISGSRVEEQVEIALAAISQAAVLLPVIAISRNPRLAFAVAAIKRGVADFFEDSVSADTLKSSVLECLDRSLRLSTHMQQMENHSATSRISLLSAEELVVLRGIVQGNPMAEIAEDLHVSLRTVHNLRRKGMRKLDLKSRAELHRISSVILQSRPMTTEFLPRTAPRVPFHNSKANASVPHAQFA